ncbi:MAG: hypothetical protein V4695_08995 [Pseudomonadota bacterium]
MPNRATGRRTVIHPGVQPDTASSPITDVLVRWIDDADPIEALARNKAAGRLMRAHWSNKGIADMAGLGLTALPDCLSELNVAELNVQNNSLTRLPGLPPSLINLNVQNNLLTQLPGLPTNLKTVLASNNYLQRLQPLPTTLQILIVEGNQLTDLPALPQTLVMLDVRGNFLRQLPELPDTAWAKNADPCFIRADLRDNYFYGADLLAFQTRIDDTFEPGSIARQQFDFDTPEFITNTPYPVSQIDTPAKAKNIVEYWVKTGIPHTELVMLRADIDAYVLHSTMSSNAFATLYGPSSNALASMDTQLFDADSHIVDSRLRKNFALIRSALPLG